MPRMRTRATGTMADRSRVGFGNYQSEQQRLVNEAVIVWRLRQTAIDEHEQAIEKLKDAQAVSIVTMHRFLSWSDIARMIPGLPRAHANRNLLDRGLNVLAEEAFRDADDDVR